jgi:hypothetical protein
MSDSFRITCGGRGSGRGSIAVLLVLLSLWNREMGKSWDEALVPNLDAVLDPSKEPSLGCGSLSFVVIGARGRESPCHTFGGGMMVIHSKLKLPVVLLRP